MTIYHTLVPPPISFLLYRFYNTTINPSNLFHFITPSMFSTFLPSSSNSFSSLSLLPYQQLLLYKPLPIICIPHHFSFFLPSLHSIFLYPLSNLPFYHYISFTHIHHPLLYAPLPHHAYVSHTFSTVPCTPRP